MEQELEQVLEQGAVRQGNMVTLDVRPHLHKKLEPFKLIMDTVKTLNEDDIFVLHATFKPTPLLGVLKLRGYVNKVEKIEKDHWITTFVNEDFNHLLQDSAGDLGLDDANNFEQDDSKIDHSIGSTAKADPGLTASVTDSNDRRPKNH